MPEFLKLIPPQPALQMLLEQLPVPHATEMIQLADAPGRILAEPIISPGPLPAFSRSTVDGYAVLANDTYGSSDSMPAYLSLTGEVLMGAPAEIDVIPGSAVLIHTGGMLPVNANAVVMLEYTQLSGGMLEVFRPVAVGENVIIAGEDVKAGELVIAVGKLLRPQDIGGLAAVGKTQVLVAAKPRVGILSSGDEVVAPDVEPGPGQVRDANSYTLSALVQAAGGEPVRYGVFPDQLASLMRAAERAIQECDVVVFTAGSSASARDLTAQVINHLGTPGVLVHGVGVRPGKPTILAVCQGKAVIGLPGNPVSALVIARLFLRPVIAHLCGHAQGSTEPGIIARLTANLPSQAGREDWVPVKLVPGADGLQAEPIFSKSNLIFSLVRADGLVRVPPDATGLSAGDQVWVVPLD
ncbi:MAG TPA: gephyrin-like molybdotransferase Glp [Anaerolineales bacterium]|nr:gephyrin-like molybdotransferase Glp [Anaerolineales bacterium]